MTRLTIIHGTLVWLKKKKENKICSTLQVKCLTWIEQESASSPKKEKEEDCKVYEERNKVWSHDILIITLLQPYTQQAFPLLCHSSRPTDWIKL